MKECVTHHHACDCREKSHMVAYLTDFEGSKTLSFSHPRIGAISKPLYAKPFPAPKQEEK